MDEPAVVGGVEPNSPAAKIGVQHGDRIIKIDGTQNPTWEQVRNADALNPNQKLHVVLQRGDEVIEKDIVPQPVTVNEVGSSGWYPDEPIVVGSLEENMPAAKAGIQVGDKITAMDGQPLSSIQDMVEKLQQNKGKAADFTVLRAGKTFHVTIQPVLTGTPQPQGSAKESWFSAFLRRIGLGSDQAPAKDAERYRIGFMGGPEIKVGKLPFPEAFKRSLEENKNNSLLLISLVGKLVQHKVSVRTVSGPIGIAQMTGAAAQAQGWAPLLVLTSIISLNLGIFNLLPIPIMDGGVILFLFVETLMQRDISLPIKERIYQAAFVFLVLFAAVVIYNDIAKTLAQRVP
jgi:regulator of sigma E protease